MLRLIFAIFLLSTFTLTSGIFGVFFKYLSEYQPTNQPKPICFDVRLRVQCCGIEINSRITVKTTIVMMPIIGVILDQHYYDSTYSLRKTLSWWSINNIQALDINWFVKMYRLFIFLLYFISFLFFCWFSSCVWFENFFYYYNSQYTDHGWCLCMLMKVNFILAFFRLFLFSIFVCFSVWFYSEI